jgi:hypothetical protein
LPMFRLVEPVGAEARSSAKVPVPPVGEPAGSLNVSANSNIDALAGALKASAKPTASNPAANLNDFIDLLVSDTLDQKPWPTAALVPRCERHDL